MKNIYFVEAGFSFDNDVYFPYATGTIAAFLKKKGCFNEKFNLAGFFFRREATDNIIEKLDNPYIVGFSCCIWNFEFNLLLAEKIKEKFPDCCIVFGGHNVSYNNNILKQYSFIDILMYGEGEQVFYDLLNNLSNGSLIDTYNISFRKGDIFITTPKAMPPDLNDLPSPYLTGIFDDILSAEDHSHLLCVLETNRGCPYSCAYCDWCAGKKVRKFPIEKVFAELNWIADNKLEYVFCADSNFGLFKRDIDIALKAAEIKKEKGYPKVFRTCFAKESNNDVFEISHILNMAGMDKGATMAYQTLSIDALKNINRKNLTLEHFSDLQKKYNDAGIPTYSELILGLPGETRESFCRGLCRLIESGQHNSISVYYLEMLPNSQMSEKSYIAKHKLESICVEFNHMHSQKKNEEVEEHSHIVRSTATLSKDDWVYCNLFSICIQCFHALGFLRLFAVYLNDEKIIDYFNFYTSLLKFILGGNSPVLYKLFSSFRDKLNSSLSGEWNFTDKDYGDITWAFEEGAYLTLIKDIDKTWTEIDSFLSSFFDDKKFYEELKTYQKAVLRKCFVKDENIVTEYDFYSYFEDIMSGRNSVLNKIKTRYIFKADKSFSSRKEFAKEIVWFGRRLGATMYLNRPNGTTTIEKQYLTGF